MKLSEEQISTLFLFTKKKWVHWYDLQVELVDHLAARIEEEMTIDKELTFQKALDKVYAGFGLFGFSKIVQQAEKAVRQKNNKIWLNAILAQFNWPNILRSVFIFLVLMLAGYLAGMMIVAFIVLTGNFILNFISLYELRHKQKKCAKLLLTQHVSAFNVSYLFMQVYLFPNLFSSASLHISSPASFFLLMISFSVIVISFASKIVVDKIFNEAEKLYPEVFAMPAH